jgi:DHA2 family multidrug resistance protein
MSSAALTIDQEVWRPKFNPWLIAVVVALGAFMEVLDTSIANVALPYMAGNLGASNDQSTWVLTSYLVSNAIILPISGWLAGALGRKRFFMSCLGIFTVSSLLCGLAPSLGLLLLFRVLQGAGGGGLQPMAQAILADTFPPTSEVWRLRCTASPPLWRRRLDQPSAAGSLLTIPGDGSFLSIFQLG